MLKAQITPEHLPSIDVAPILTEYNPITKRLNKDYLIETAVDDRGIVQPELIIEDVMATVDPAYRWPNDFCDTHHFVWRRSDYHAEAYSGNTIPHEYRETPFHKGYLPRSLHMYLHMVTSPPPIPSLEVMQDRVESFTIAKKLFMVARRAVVFEKQYQRSFESPDRPGYVRGIFKPTNDIDHEVLADVHMRFLNRYGEQLERLYDRDIDFISDFETLLSQDVHYTSAALGRIAAINSVNLLPLIGKLYTNRK